LKKLSSFMIPGKGDRSGGSDFRRLATVAISPVGS